MTKKSTHKGRIQMASKLDQAVDYIEALRIGSKLSIKSLAKDLSISDGTAYHAIKRAEQLGLVVTLPKAGTTRIRKKRALQDIDLTITSLKSLVGAECLTGEITDDFVLKDIYIGSDSALSARHALETSGNNALCIVGNRAEIQEIAIVYGANLLLVNHAQISDELLAKASDKGCVVLRTKWSPIYVMSCLTHNTKMFMQSLVDLNVRQWMRPPQFLYLDDLVADGIGIFKDYGLRKIAVVDREKTICGYLRIEAAFDADRSQRVSRVYDQKSFEEIVDISATMKDVLAHFLSGQVFYLPVVEDKKLVGILYCSDILEIVMQSQKTEKNLFQLPLLSELDEEVSGKRCIYTVKINAEIQDEQDIHSELKSVMELAVTEYCRKNKINGTELDSYYNLESTSSLAEEMYISIEEVFQGKEICVISCEAYDDRISYGRYHMTIHR